MNSTLQAIPAKPAPPADLEIKDAHLIFSRVWKQLEQDYGKENLRFPKELILLGGAPGGRFTHDDAGRSHGSAFPVKSLRLRHGRRSLGMSLAAATCATRAPPLHRPN